MSYIPAKTSNYVRIDSEEDLFNRDINAYFSAVDRDLQNLFMLNNLSLMIGIGNENEILQYDSDIASVAFTPSLGAWTIGNDLLYAGASATYIGLKPGSGIWLGDEAFLSAPFSVDSAGVLTAHSGTVGDWNLTATKLWKGTDIDADYIALDPDVGIHMGAEAFADAKFSVTKKGALKSTSGLIGGWTIGTTKLSAGSGSTNITLDTVEGIYMGNDSSGSAPFAVDSLGYMRATLTELTAPIIQTNASPGTDRVVINSSGIHGYDDVLGATFVLPTDGSAPIFANGIIQSATIIDTSLISNDFKTSSELPWIEMTDSGIAYRETNSVGQYGSGVQYGDGTLYGVGVSAYYGNSAKPVLSIEAERTFADIHLYARAAVPSGASTVGDLIVKSGALQLCTTSGTPGTYKACMLTGDALTGTFDGIVGGTTPADGSFTTLSTTGKFTMNNSGASDGLQISQNAVQGANNWALIVTTAQEQVNEPLVLFKQDNADSTMPVLTLQQDGSGPAIDMTVGGQIKFPATAVPSADANTLDDYEEGTWTPFIRFDGGTTGQAYSVQDGAYTKVGNKVTVTAQIYFSAKGSSTGDATITGLPFTSANGNAYYTATSNYTSGIDFADALMGRVRINNTIIDLLETTNAGVVTSIDDTDFVNNSRMFFTVTYLI